MYAETSLAGPSQLRLLEIGERDKMGVLHYSIHRFSLSSCLSYSALSYMWGWGENRQVVINGSPFDVSHKSMEISGREEWMRKRRIPLD
jgi:hypothetical protein